MIIKFTTLTEENFFHKDTFKEEVRKINNFFKKYEIKGHLKRNTEPLNYKFKGNRFNLGKLTEEENSEVMDMVDLINLFNQKYNFYFKFAVYDMFDESVVVKIELHAV